MREGTAHLSSVGPGIFELDQCRRHRGHDHSEEQGRFLDWIVVMWTEENLILAKATECEMRAKEAIDLSVRRYFAKLARDYRHLAKLAELAELAEPELSEQSPGLLEAAIKATAATAADRPPAF